MGRDMLGSLRRATALQQCVALHVHSYIMAAVTLPLIVMLPLERRARQRFEHERVEAAGASAAADTLHGTAAAAEVLPAQPFSAACLVFFCISSAVWWLAAAVAVMH